PGPSAGGQDEHRTFRRATKFSEGQKSGHSGRPPVSDSQPGQERNPPVAPSSVYLSIYEGWTEDMDRAPGFDWDDVSDVAYRFNTDDWGSDAFSGMRWNPRWDSEDWARRFSGIPIVYWQDPDATDEWQIPTP